MQINQLSQATDVNAGDLTVIFSTANGDTRALPISVLLAFLQQNLTAGGGMMTQYSAPNATGFSVTVNPATDGQNVYLLLTPVAGYAAGTIKLPELVECVDGQEVLVSCTQLVTTLTVDGNGAMVNGAPATLAANGFFRLRYDGVLKFWNRIG